MSSCGCCTATTGALAFAAGAVLLAGLALRTADVRTVDMIKRWDTNGLWAHAVENLRYVDLSLYDVTHLRQTQIAGYALLATGTTLVTFSPAICCAI